MSSDRTEREYGPDDDDRMAEYGTGYDDRTDDTAYDDRTDDDDDSLLGEGLAGLLLLAGIALFLFPEPATSGIGILLIATGVAVWLLDWAM